MTLPAPGEKLDEIPIGPFDATAVAAYARASGDDNPIHLDPALAASVGFAAPPVHGMRLMAEIGPALAAWRPDLAIRRLAGAFAEPLLVGEPAKLAARVLKREADSVLLRVTIQGPRRGPCLVAEAVLAPGSAAA
ncbi:MAG: MaoC family dehydratase [Hyphomicrobiales bacterium]|nr:MaoC family dehydratase [Hyphomicrobiales bacterium]